MTLNQFWNIVDQAHQTSGGNMEKKCQLLETELRRLDLDEVLSFDAHFTECRDRAYHWPLWAAAYIMGGGCGDDSFMDFRSTLISMGRDTFERAMADPQSLVELDLKDGREMKWQGYQYVASEVAADLSGGCMFPRSRPHPEEPSGEPWHENTVARLYPKLAQRYGYTGQPEKGRLSILVSRFLMSFRRR